MMEIINLIKELSFEAKWSIIASLIAVFIAYGLGYQVGFKRGFDGDPLFKKH